VKARKVYCKFESSLLQRIVGHMFVAVAMHWTMQSILYADPTERRFRIGLDILLTLLFSILLIPWLAWQLVVVPAFLLAHTVNFLFNAHLCALSKDYGMVSHTYEQYERYVQGFQQRAQAELSLQSIELRGGLTRQSWTPYSDLDVRLVRKPGFINGLRACWFLLRERTHALFAWFPLDAYVRDAAYAQPVTSGELLPAVKLIADGERSQTTTTGPKPTIDLFGRQDRAATVSVQPKSPQTGKETTHPLVYLRGAFVHDFGQTSYRIAYFLPEFGFDTTLVQLGHQASERVEQGIKLVVLPVSHIPVISALWVNYLALRDLLQRPCEVLLCNPGMIFCALAYKWLRPQAKLVVDVRSIPVEVKGLQGWLMDRTFKLAVQSKALDGLSVITPGTLQMVLEQYGGRRDIPTVIWPSGVDEDLFDPTISGKRIRTELGLQDAFVLMYHGSLTPTRGLDTVLHALHILQNQGDTRTKAVFIGKETPYTAVLMAQAKELGIAERVLFLGPVAHEAIPEYVAAADAGLDPLPDHQWWNFSSPMKVYEYLRMGKPVLATDILAHRDVSPAVLLVPERDPDALAATIINLTTLDDPARAKLEQLALRAGACNTWRMRAESLSSFLNEHFFDKATTTQRT
jgi:glycosyltransferase involved in cell wall biosynthesis